MVNACFVWTIHLAIFYRMFWTEQTRLCYIVRWLRWILFTFQLKRANQLVTIPIQQISIHFCWNRINESRKKNRFIDRDLLCNDSENWTLTNFQIRNNIEICYICNEASRYGVLFFSQKNMIVRRMLFFLHQTFSWTFFFLKRITLFFTHN